MRDALTAAFFHSLWQDVLVWAMLWSVLRCVPRSAHGRYLLACGALAILTLLPFVTIWYLLPQVGGPEIVASTNTAPMQIIVARAGRADSLPGLMARGHVERLLVPHCLRTAYRNRPCGATVLPGAICWRCLVVS